MRIRQLEYFVQVCDTGSITRAAAQLNVAQPALGMQIKALEDELGVQLLRRSHRGTTITKEGAIFLEEARNVVTRMRDVRQRLREGGSTAPTVSLGLTPSLATVLTSPLLEALSHVKPRIKVQIHEEFSHTLVAYVDNGSLDMALAYSVPAGRLPRGRELLREVLFFIARPGSRYDAEGPMPFDQLSEIAFVMPSERDFVRRLVEDSMQRHERTLNIVYEAESMTAMKEMIMSGLAYGILPYGNIMRDVAARALVARPIVDPPISRVLYALSHGDRAKGFAQETVLATIKGLLRTICAGSPALSLLDGRS